MRVCSSPRFPFPFRPQSLPARFFNTGISANGSSNGTLDTTATQTDGGMWEAVLYMGGALLLVTLFCGAGIWLMLKWADSPVVGSSSHTARVEL